MQIRHINESTAFNSDKYVAEEFLEGDQSNVRIIKLASGTSLPPHKHGVSDLMLYVTQGEATFQTQEGIKRLSAGNLVFIPHTEELKVSNQGEEGVILLAFLTPKFPTRG